MKFERPPARLSVVSRQQRDNVLAAKDEAWIEKARRFCSLHGRNLRRVSEGRFGIEANDHLNWLASLLLLEPDRNELPCDPARLSAALYAIDAGRKPSKRQVKIATDQIAALHAWHSAGKSQPADPAQGFVFEYVQGLWRREVQSAPNVLILSPNPYSLYTLAVMRLCLHLKVPIVGLLIREFTPARFIEEYRRDGPRLLRKVWRKLVLRRDENAASSTISLSSLLSHINNDYADARRLAQDNNIPVLSADDWHAEDVLKRIRNVAPQVGLFTGGGMTGADLQACFSTGILNMHMGHLPGFKGMDVVENPILEGRWGNVGATAHIMDKGLDTGPVIQRVDYDPYFSESLGSLRNSIAGMLPLLAIDSALGLGSGRLELQPQETRGRQYYFVHPRLRPIIEIAIEQRRSAARDRYSRIYDQMVSDLEF